MSEAQGSGLKDPVEEGRRRADPQPRAVGSPLPVGSRGNFNGVPGPLTETPRPSAAPPPGRALANSAANNPIEASSGIQRAVAALRAALPFVQRMLPLLDGNIVTAVSNILAPHHHAPTTPPPPPVNLAPIEQGLADLQTQHRELRDQVVEQNSSLKRVEDHLEMVREATDRNTLEQQELMEDLKVVGRKVKVFAFVALGLLAVSVIINIVLYLQVVRILR